MVPKSNVQELEGEQAPDPEKDQEPEAHAARPQTTWRHAVRRFRCAKKARFASLVQAKN